MRMEMRIGLEVSVLLFCFSPDWLHSQGLVDRPIFLGAPCPRSTSADWRWELSVIDGGGRRSSLVLERDEIPHVAYASANELRYAFWDEQIQDWEIEVVDDSGESVSHVSLALDEARLPAIAYAFHPPEHHHDPVLKFARKNDQGIWEKKVVDDDWDTGEFCSLAFDRKGNPLISYYCWDDLSLRLARWAGSSWGISIIDRYIWGQGGGCYGITSLQIAPDGAPCIAYDGYPGDRLKYAREMVGSHGSWWKIEKIHHQPEATIGWLSNSLQFDGNGIPHVAYYYRSPQGDGFLMYAKKEAGVWTRERVMEGAKLLSASLRFNVQNQPFIGFYDYDENSVWLTWKSTAGWKSESIPDENELRGDTSLALAKKRSPRLTCWDRSEGTLKYVAGRWNQPAGSPPKSSSDVSIQAASGNSID